MTKSVPTNKALYNRVKNEAKRKFDVWPSAYASGWLVREYKKRGGKYSTRGSPKKTTRKRNNKTGLQRWFDEEWIDVCQLPNIVPCGRPSTKYGGINKWKKTYPYCRPRYKITNKTPAIAGKLSDSQIKKRCRQKKNNPYKKIMPKKKSNKRTRSKRRSRSKRRTRSTRKRSKPRARRRKSKKRSRSRRKY